MQTIPLACGMLRGASFLFLIPLLLGHPARAAQMEITSDWRYVYVQTFAGWGNLDIENRSTEATPLEPFDETVGQFLTYEDCYAETQATQTSSVSGSQIEAYGSILARARGVRSPELDCNAIALSSSVAIMELLVSTPLLYRIHVSVSGNNYAYCDLELSNGDSGSLIDVRIVSNEPVDYSFTGRIEPGVYALHFVLTGGAWAQSDYVYEGDGAYELSVGFESIVPVDTRSFAAVKSLY